MTPCPSDATKPHPKETAARLVDEWLEPVPFAEKPDSLLLLNLVERIGSALHAAATEARRGALEEAAGKADAVATGARVSARYFRNAGDEMRTEKWAAAEGAALDIRDSILALIAGAGDGAASAPHPMEAAARLVDEWSAANFRTSAERPDPSALLDLVKRLAARKVEA